MSCEACGELGDPGKLSLRGHGKGTQPCKQFQEATLSRYPLREMTWGSAPGLGSAR